MISENGDPITLTPTTNEEIDLLALNESRTKILANGRVKEDAYSRIDIVLKENSGRVVYWDGSEGSIIIPSEVGNKLQSDTSINTEIGNSYVIVFNFDLLRSLETVDGSLNLTLSNPVTMTVEESKSITLEGKSTPEGRIACAYIKGSEKDDDRRCLNAIASILVVDETFKFIFLPADNEYEVRIFTSSYEFYDVSDTDISEPIPTSLDEESTVEDTQGQSETPVTIDEITETQKNVLERRFISAQLNKLNDAQLLLNKTCVLEAGDSKNWVIDNGAALVSALDDITFSWLESAQGICSKLNADTLQLDNSYLDCYGISQLDAEQYIMSAVLDYLNVETDILKQNIISLINNLPRGACGSFR